MRFLGGAALVAVTMLALTGCGSQAAQPTSSPTITVAPSTAASSAPVTTPTTAPTSTAPATATATPEPSTASAAVDPNRPKGQCPDTGIGVGVYPTDAGAGSLYYRVLFTNTSGSSCVLRGTPGVSVVGDGNGTQLGQPATAVQSGVRTVTLADGDSVAAVLKVTNIGTDGGPLSGCTVKKGDGYRIYPPHSRRAFFFADPKAVACAPGPVFMSVGPVGAS